MASFRTVGGKKIIGTLQVLRGVALVSDIDPETGAPTYTGDTKVEFDSAETVIKRGYAIYVAEDGSEHTFRSLIQEDDQYSMDNWRKAVVEGETHLGYADWVRAQEKSGDEVEELVTSVEEASPASIMDDIDDLPLPDVVADNLSEARFAV